MLLTSRAGRLLLRQTSTSCGNFVSLQRGQAFRCRASSSTTGQQPLAVPVPPNNYDYKAEILPETILTVKQQYPDLLPLVEEGNLVVSVRPAHYTERRTDGYQEPQLIFILGTAHVSQQSAAEVEQVVAAVQPQAVVVELCKSRVGVLQVPEHHGHQQQTTASPQQQQRQQDQQQELQQSAQSNQASAAAIPSGSASDSLDECITVLQDRLGSHQTASSTSSGLDTAAAAHYWARRQKTAAYLASSGRAAATKSSSSSGNQQQDDVQLAEPSSSSSRSSKATNPMSLSGANFLSALTRSAQLGGQSGLLLRLLIAGQARKVAGQYVGRESNCKISREPKGHLG
eukprot:GHUV01039848.1.p1 GENE.GHUV01039848.1~~GHUV01039848.1.p1  ORF type:complete len:343 (+),score=108.49 GHUV01039848.1:341-1369(+)